jgi:hypothetical protein
MSALEMRFLNARQGDAIWIRWGEGHQLMVDMGTTGAGTALAGRLRALPKEARRLDLLVVTHVDTDHIGGVLSCVVDPDDPVPGLTFDDVWFNGWEHLHGQIPVGRGDLEPMGGAQGEAFTSWLREQHWNAAFGGAAVVRGDALLPFRDLPDGLRLTVLGPTTARLEALQADWKAEVEEALSKGKLDEVSPGLEPMGPSTPPELDSRVDLELLAEAPAHKDPSKANGSSITLLLEWRATPESGPRRVLLTGDAFADEVVAGLALVDGGGRVPLDLLKVPHHGSRQNMSRALVEAVDCPLWVFSSDGTTFRHPDAQAIARILAHGSRAQPTLAFNVPSTFNGWWENPDWRKMFGYDVRYGTAEEGLTIVFGPP